MLPPGVTLCGMNTHILLTLQCKLLLILFVVMLNHFGAIQPLHGIRCCRTHGEIAQSEPLLLYSLDQSELVLLDSLDQSELLLLDSLGSKFIDIEEVSIVSTKPETGHANIVLHELHLGPAITTHKITYIYMGFSQQLKAG